MASLLRERVTRWKRRLRARRASREADSLPSASTTTLFHAVTPASVPVVAAPSTAPLASAAPPTTAAAGGAPTAAAAAAAPRRRAAPQRLSIHARQDELEAWLHDGEHWAEVPDVDAWLDRVPKAQEQQRILHMLDAVLKVACHTRLHHVLQMANVLEASGCDLHACRPELDASAHWLRFELWQEKKKKKKQEKKTTTMTKHPQATASSRTERWERWWIDFALDTFRHPPPSEHETHRIAMQHPRVHCEVVASWLACFRNLERVAPASREPLAQRLLADLVFPSFAAAAGETSWMYHLDPAANPTAEEHRIAARFSAQMRHSHGDKLEALRRHHTTRVHLHTSTSEAEHVQRSLPQFVLSAPTGGQAPWTFAEVVLMVLGHAHQGIREHRLYALREEEGEEEVVEDGFAAPKLLRSVLTTHEPNSVPREFHLTIGSFLQAVLAARCHGLRSGGSGMAAGLAADCFVTTSLRANLTLAALSQLTHLVDATAHLSLGRRLSLDERHTLEMLLKILVHQRAESIIAAHPLHASAASADADRVQACMSVLSALERQQVVPRPLLPSSSTSTTESHPSSPVEEIMQRLRDLASSRH